jgi:hypothetical protein
VEAAVGIYDGLEDEEYRAIPALSHSDLKKWASDDDVPKGRHLLIGNVLHCVLTRPQHAATLYATMVDEVDLRTVEGQAALLDFEEKTGKKGIRPSEKSMLGNMVASIKDHPEASKLLAAPGEVELAVVADLGGLNGHLSKGLIDKRCRKCLVDFKSTGAMDEQEFLNSFYKFGYDSQGAHYVDLMHAHLKEFLPIFFVCVSKRSYKTWVVRLSPEQYTTGRRWYRDILRLYSLNNPFSAGKTDAA